MALAIPKPDVYYIDFNSGVQKKSNAAETFPINVPIVKDTLATVDKTINNLIAAQKEMTQKYNVIASQEELDHCVNGTGNVWRQRRKGEQKRQYYIRHPKIADQIVLIEANAFVDYIESEQKKELINYILSHCRATEVLIDKRQEGKTKFSISIVKLGAGKRRSHKVIGDYYHLQRKAGLLGIKLEEPLEHYYWLEPALMSSISALTKGSSLEISHNMDYHFGFDSSVAKKIGLVYEQTAKYEYSIFIQC